ncbi:hypothetical protein J0687_26995, partial [Vibrio alginolyticus]
MIAPSELHAYGLRAKTASQTLAKAAPQAKNPALLSMAERLRARRAEIEAANRADLEAARLAGLSTAKLDRLR